MISYYNLTFDLHHLLIVILSTARGGSQLLWFGVLSFLWAERSYIPRPKQDKRLARVVRLHIMQSASTPSSTSSGSRHVLGTSLRSYSDARNAIARGDSTNVPSRYRTFLAIPTGASSTVSAAFPFHLPTCSPIIGHSSAAELDIAEIQSILAQLETYLGPGGLTAFGAALAEEVHQDNSLDASDKLLDEMETLRDLRDRARDICVRIWERDGATKIWEKSRQCLRPFQEALDIVDNLYDRTLSLS